MNNYEKIKNMSIEEMVEFINSCESNPCVTHCFYNTKFCTGSCIKQLKIWLESEVNDEKNINVI